MPSPRNDLVKNCRVHPMHWLISTQVLQGDACAPTPRPVPNPTPLPAPAPTPLPIPNPTPRPVYLTNYVMTDSNIKTAVAAWLSDATAAEATYGHIST